MTTCRNPFASVKKWTVHWFIFGLVCVTSIPLPINAKTMSLGTNFLPPGWGGWSLERGNYADFFAESWHNVSGTEPVFKTAFEQEVAVYTGGFRWMEANAANRSTSNKFHHSGKWEDRKTKSDPEQYEPVCYEYQIHLSNRLHKDYYVNVPHTADDDYFTKLATLIKNTLDPSLKCYVEWGNEIWNDAASFEGGRWSIAKADSLWGKDENTIHSRAKYSAYRSLRMFAKFEEVFGTGASDRLVKVIGGWDGHDYTEVQLATLADSRLNPDGIKADAYALAPYIGGSLDGSDTDILQKMTADLIGYVKAGERFRIVIDLAKKSGLLPIAYEAGIHTITNADAVLANPGIYQVVKTYYDTMSQYFSVMFHFNHVGDPPWGAKLYVAQPDSTAHVYRALKDWAGEHRLPVTRERALSQPVVKISTSRMHLSVLRDPVRATTGTIFMLDGSVWHASANRSAGRRFSGVYIVQDARP
jgi:hypothetical protein